jgi:hypothetical protein
MRRPLLKACVVALAAAAMILLPPRNTDARERCADIFAKVISEGNGQELDRAFPRAGIYRDAAGRYVLTMGDKTHSAASATGLATRLVTTLNSGADAGAPLSLYFNGLSPDEAWNFIGTLRLKSGERDVAGIVNGGGKPPREPPGAGGHTAAAGGGEGPEGGAREPWTTAAFRPAAKHYDWSKAAVAPIDQPPPFADSSPNYSFQITVPVAAKQTAGFKLWVIFRRSATKPDVTAIGDAVTATLKEKQLQQAAVQDTVMRLRTRFAKSYPGSRTALAMDFADLTIVELEPNASRATDG